MKMGSSHLMYLLTVLASLKGVLIKGIKWVSLIFSNRNCEKFLFEKISETQKKNFQARLLWAACLCRRQAQNSE
jgi:hypothetical protein